MKETASKENFSIMSFTYVITGLGVVAALAWNDAIQSLIKFYFPFDQSSVWAKVLYAVIITAAIVVLTVYLTRWFSKK